MTNKDTLDAIQKLLALQKEGKLTQEATLEGIDTLVNPKVVTRRDVERFRSKLNYRPQ